jgi:hypothetical protein
LHGKAGASAELDWGFLMGYGPRPYRMKFENNVKELQNCIKWGVPGPGYARLVGTNVLDRTVDEFRGWHFNGPATIEKNTQYALDNGLAGVGWWYLTCDTLDDRSLTLTAGNTLRANHR